MASGMDADHSQKGNRVVSARLPQLRSGGSQRIRSDSSAWTDDISDTPVSRERKGSLDEVGPVAEAAATVATSQRPLSHAGPPVTPGVPQEKCYPVDGYFSGKTFQLVLGSMTRDNPSCQALPPSRNGYFGDHTAADAQDKIMEQTTLVKSLGDRLKNMRTTEFQQTLASIARQPTHEKGKMLESYVSETYISLTIEMSKAFFTGPGVRASNSVIAVILGGSGGRREVSLFSDIDLMAILSKEETRDGKTAYDLSKQAFYCTALDALDVSMCIDTNLCPVAGPYSSGGHLVNDVQYLTDIMQDGDNGEPKEALRESILLYVDGPKQTLEEGVAGLKLYENLFHNYHEWLSQQDLLTGVINAYSEKITPYAMEPALDLPVSLGGTSESVDVKNDMLRPFQWIVKAVTMFFDLKGDPLHAMYTHAVKPLKENEIEKLVEREIRELIVNADYCRSISCHPFNTGHLIQKLVNRFKPAGSGRGPHRDIETVLYKPKRRLFGLGSKVSTKVIKLSELLQPVETFPEKVFRAYYTSMYVRIRLHHRTQKHEDGLHLSKPDWWQDGDIEAMKEAVDTINQLKAKSSKWMHGLMTLHENGWSATPP